MYLRFKHIAALIAALAFIAPAFANVDVKEVPFRLVMIDSATEAKLGAFPIDRAHVAKAVDVLTKAGAKAVVLKFFYDLPSNAASDEALSKAISTSTVLLQARIDDTEAKPNLGNSLPHKFLLSNIDSLATSSINGNSGWLPLPALASAASAIGFVDTTDVNVVPAFVRYQSKAVTSLTVASLQVALSSSAPRLVSGKFIYFDKARLPLDAKNQILLSANALDEYSSVNKLSVLSFNDLLNGNFLPTDIKGKVIVVGYDGSKSPQLKTKFGAIKVHRAFYLGLIDLWRQLATN